MKKTCILALLLTLTVITVQAQPPTQTKADLEKEKRDIQNELKDIQGVYDKVKGQTRQSLTQLNMLNRKINLQESYINNINREMRFIDDDMYRSSVEITRLQRQLDTLKSQYARTIVYAYKNRSSFDYVNFIFSANTFNDAIRRISYLRSYRSYRENQVNAIDNMKVLIAKRQQQQLARKEEKSSTLQDQNKQRQELAVQREEKDQVVSKLKSQEKDLSKQIAVRKKRDRDIQNAITTIVRREIENAKRDEAARLASIKKDEEVKTNLTTVKPNTNPTTNTTTAVTPTKKAQSFLELSSADIKLGSDFKVNMGRLPWPVDNGFVSIPFGHYTIEGTTLVGDNPGITIATPAAGGAVKAVFDGDVVSVNSYGEGLMVVIRHGKYFTTYSNLSSTAVTKGQTVKTGQVIGKVGQSEDGSGGQLDFMLMEETKNMNPASWLHRL